MNSHKCILWHSCDVCPVCYKTGQEVFMDELQAWESAPEIIEIQKKSQKLETKNEAEVSPEVDFDVEKPEAKIPNFMEKNVQIENKKRKKLLSRIRLF